jgi:hypothetical protein
VWSLRVGDGRAAVGAPGGRSRGGRSRAPPVEEPGGGDCWEAAGWEGEQPGGCGWEGRERNWLWYQVGMETLTLTGVGQSIK